jgi:hypothetical protein
MVELRDEEDGRVALIMDKEELPLALEALMRAGYGLEPPAEDGGESEEGGEAGQPDDSEAEEPEAGDPEADEEPEDAAEEPDETDEEPVDEDEEPEAPVRRRRSRSS